MAIARPMNTPQTRPSLTLVRRYDVPVDLVWAAWIEPDMLRLWFGPDGGPVEDAQTDLRPGGKFRVAFRTEDGERHVCLGTYRDVVPNRRLTFSWEWITMPERRSQVELTFRDLGGATELTLHHAQFFDETARDAHHEGWTGALDKLGRTLRAAAGARSMQRQG